MKFKIDKPHTHLGVTYYPPAEPDLPDNVVEWLRGPAVIGQRAADREAAAKIPGTPEYDAAHADEAAPNE